MDSHVVSWLEVALHHPSAKPFDEHIKETVTAIKNFANVAEAIKLVQGHQSDLVFLTTATRVKYQCLIYHHLEKFVSPILNQTAGHYVLIRFGDSA
eukprot:12314728-Ditylum_brightwellii.AAC.2